MRTKSKTLCGRIYLEHLRTLWVCYLTKSKSHCILFC